jgi:glutamine cyclotransferase
MFLGHILLAAWWGAGGASLAAAQARVSPAVQGYRIVHVYPHDPDAFTQGLVFVDGHLYESTGLNGRSSLRMVDLQSGKVLQHHELPAQYFGEGLTTWGNSLGQQPGAVDLEGGHGFRLRPLQLRAAARS